MNHAMLRPTPLACALLLALAACTRQEPAPPAPPAGGAPLPPMSAAPAATARSSGKVLQVQQGGGYTYAEVAAANGQKVWIAGSPIDVKAGDTVEWGSFAVMRNFNAKSLGRSFEEILFVDQWGPPGGKSVATSPHGNFGAAPAAAAAPAGGDSGVVKSVVNASGYSYIEVERGGATLWLAAMETPMKPGDKIQWQGGSEMLNFTAKSLGRSFERIIFASSVTVAR